MKYDVIERRFVCLSCDGRPEFALQDFRRHLQQVHAITFPAKGTRRMLMHVNCGQQHISDFTWTIGEVQFVEQVIVDMRGAPRDRRSQSREVRHAPS
jgi:hypothetical protein